MEACRGTASGQRTDGRPADGRQADGRQTRRRRGQHRSHPSPGPLGKLLSRRAGRQDTRSESPVQTPAVSVARWIAPLSISKQRTTGASSNVPVTGSDGRLFGHRLPWPGQSSNSPARVWRSAASRSAPALRWTRAGRAEPGSDRFTERSGYPVALAAEAPGGIRSARIGRARRRPVGMKRSRAASL